MSESKNRTPSSIYRGYVDDHSIELDPIQLDAIEQLDSLHYQLVSPPRANTLIDQLKSRFMSKPAAPLTGFYLWGGVGTGKTLLMDIFFNSLPENKATRTHFHRFMRSVHDQKNEIRDQRDPLAIIAARYAKGSKLLCLDEFTVSDITDAMIMSGLLKHLFNNGITLVTTSNTPIMNLYHNGLQRDRFLPAIQLLQEHTVSINVDGGIDYRMAFLQDSKIFHVPADKISENQLLNSFMHLGGAGENTHPQKTEASININGRDIAIRHRASGVIWFDFDSICRTHRSNSDFIEIARQYHTVIISGIPTLNKQDDDAARRLIELVDELYDRNVKLLISSDNPPSGIYNGNRLKETFKRTTSRLTEISSNEYLAKPHLS
jgi:cell division protein ZapE